MSEFVNYTAVCRLYMGEGIGILVFEVQGTSLKVQGTSLEAQDKSLVWSNSNLLYQGLPLTKCQGCSYNTLVADQSFNPNVI